MECLKRTDVRVMLVGFGCEMREDRERGGDGGTDDGGECGEKCGADTDMQEYVCSCSSYEFGFSVM